MQYNIIFDFDNTITDGDTLHILASRSRSHCPPLSYFTKEYIKDVQRVKSQNSSREDAYDLEIAKAEDRSIQRLQDKRFFQGYTYGDIAMLAKLVRCREGWQSFFLSLVEKQPTAEFYVLSVNWSALFIRYALERFSSHANKLSILSNELEWDDRGIATGVMNGKSSLNIRTASDKLQRMKEISNNDRVYTVYFGDSEGDLACLLNADLGVLIGDKPLFIEDRNITLVRNLDSETWSNWKTEGNTKILHCHNWTNVGTNFAFLGIC